MKQDNHWTITALGTFSNAEYTNNPLAQVNYNGMDAATNEMLNTFANPVTGEKRPLRVVADGMKVGSTPQAAVMLSVKYNINYWFFEESKRTTAKTITIVNAETGNSKSYQLASSSGIRVEDGDEVVHGQQLNEGALNPHDILRIVKVLRQKAVYTFRRFL